MHSNLVQYVPAIVQCRVQYGKDFTSFSYLRLISLDFDESEITAKYEKRVNICHDRLAWQNIVDLMGKCGVNIFYIFNKEHTF